MAPPVILTTGANQGLGLAIVQVLAQREPTAHYILCARNTSAGDEALAGLRRKGIQADIEVLQLDVTDDNQIQAAVDHVQSKYQRLDVLINNAGILRPPKADTLTALRKTYDDLCSVNLTSVAVMTTAFMPLLHASPDPKVINITSGLGSIGNTLTKKMGRFPAYGASKIGMNGATVHMQTAENDRIEAAGGAGGSSDNGSGGSGGVPAKVRFFIVAPGVLKTAFNGYYAHGKDPVDGTEAVVRLALDQKAEYEGGTHWEFEGGEMRQVPW